MRIVPDGNIVDPQAFDTVKEGDVLFILEVMKTEFPHEAPRDGTVSAVHITEGQDNVDGDIVAVEIE